MRVRKAVVPAAGMGTRLRPITRTIPKELLPIVDTAAIDFIVREAVESGIDELVLVTSAKKPLLLQHLEAAPPPLRVTIVVQDEPRGLGHAVLCAREAIGDEPFAVMLPDDLYDGPSPTRELCELHASTGMSAIGLIEVPAEEVSRYGVVRPAWERDRVVG
ncbi:MAG: sugar phosphate nucleotidyltransferase, partial [Myxococcota bacterium]